MRKVIDKIEIKQPPVEELAKRHSCLRRSCATSCGCVVFIVIISLLILKFTVGPQVKEVKDLPPAFAETVPLYDSETIEKIEITEGSERNKAAEYAAFFPKLFISPVVVALDKGSAFIPSYDPLEYENKKTLTRLFDKFVAFMKTPVADHRDEYYIEWRGLEADRTFIEEFYRTKLKRNGFELGATSKHPSKRQFSFTKSNIDGILYIHDQPETEETDLVSLRVTIDIE